MEKRIILLMVNGDRHENAVSTRQTLMEALKKAGEEKSDVPEN